MGGAPLLWPPSFAVRSPRSEARHSCDLPRRGAHSYLLSGGGWGRAGNRTEQHGPASTCPKDRATWSQEQPSGPRRHSCGAPRREYALTPRGGAGRDRPTWSQEQPSGPRRHSCGVPRREYARSLLARHQQQSRSPPVAASAQGRAFVRGGISLMWPPPTRQTPPSAASRPIAHPPVQQSSQGLRAAYARGGTSLMRPPLTRHPHSP